MKTKNIYLLIALLIPMSILAQSRMSKQSVGITYTGIGANNAFYWESLVGAGSYTGEGFYSIGVNYVHPISKTIDIETGLEYSHLKYKFSNASLGPDAPAPSVFSYKLFTIPATIRLKFLNYFFLNTGLLVDFNGDNKSNMDSQSGLGAIIGVGAQYDFGGSPIAVFVNPFYKHHAIVPFNRDGNYQLRTDEGGVRIGVSYLF